MRVPLGRAAPAGLAAGAIAGAATGIGARVAMRVLALHAGGRSSGLYSSTGARVGDVTFGGTMYVIGIAAALCAPTRGYGCACGSLCARTRARRAQRARRH